MNLMSFTTKIWVTVAEPHVVNRTEELTHARRLHTPSRLSVRVRLKKKKALSSFQWNEETIKLPAVVPTRFLLERRFTIIAYYAKKDIKAGKEKLAAKIISARNVLEITSANNAWKTICNYRRIILAML